MCGRVPIFSLAGEPRITKTLNHGGVAVNFLVHILKGIVIGIATLVPGVSGGTMAIIVGIYDELIHSISSFFQDIRKNPG